MSAALDHLVVVAATLDEGVAWCERTLGITPGPGGQHPLMGTHNRLFSITSPDFPLAYFEIIAIDPAAPDPGRRRWFDMDDAALQERVRREGPQLVADVSPSARKRWVELDYRPGSLKRVAIDLESGSTSEPVPVRFGEAA